MIVFDHVSKRYPNGREGLSNASLHIEEGEMVFLTGRSGAGKSTVLKLIALLERPTRGTVVIGGKNTGSLKSRHLPAFRRPRDPHRLAPAHRHRFSGPQAPAGAARFRQCRIAAGGGGYAAQGDRQAGARGA